METKCIIAGGRDFDNADILSDCMYKLFPKPDGKLLIVSGAARGADRLGEDFAYKYELPFIQFPADWDKHGKSAGYIRNSEMSRYADRLVAFWDGKSRGTKNMIELMLRSGKPVDVFNYKGEPYEDISST